MNTYDERHPFCVITRRGVRWAGDPARGEWVTKRMEPKRKGRGKRH